MTMHASSLKRSAQLAAPLLLAGVSACAFFFPFGYDNLAETRVRAACHFAFTCCTPIERGLFFDAPHRDEGTCVDETLEDESIGFIAVLDQLAKDAVSRGTAVYDADAAERCSRPVLDAVNACDVDQLTNAAGQIDGLRVLFLTDVSDPECTALAGRNYVRGQVGDGDDCESSFDCEDFGECVVDPEERAETLTTKGSCVTPHAEGDECDDGVGCQPGLSCIPDAEGTFTCEQLDPQEDGEPCEDDPDCESGNCATIIGDGACEFSGNPCVDDVDCEPGEFCDGDLTFECAPAEEVSVEICDGLD
jgi:hypothetical protein